MTFCHNKNMLKISKKYMFMCVQNTSTWNRMLFCSTKTSFINAIVDLNTRIQLLLSGSVTECCPSVVSGISVSGGYMVFLCMTRAPSSKNSRFDTHIRRKVPSDARMEPPIHVVYKRSWGAKILKQKTIKVII